MILAGRVSDLRAASPTRYLEVATSGPGSQRWIEDVRGARIIERRSDRIRLLLQDAADLPALAASVSALAGNVTSFSLEPPSLSEVFTQAVRR